MKETKNNKSSIILILMLITIIMGLIGFIGVTQLIKKPQNNDTENKQEENKNVEIELNDFNIIKEVSIDIDKLLASNQKEEFALSKTYFGYGFKYGVLKNTLTPADKQLIALETVEWDKITTDAWKNYDKINDLVMGVVGDDMSQQNAFIANSKQVTEEKLNAHSMILFGEKIDNPVEEVGSCPPMYYDANAKIYYRPSPECGGTSSRVVKSYKSKFTQKSDKIYAYVSFAYLDYENPEQLYVYKDVEAIDGLWSAGNTLKDRYTAEDPIYNEEFFTVNENNYQNFSEYKFTFKKDDNNNYYFVSVEQTK